MKLTDEQILQCWEAQVDHPLTTEKIVAFVRALPSCGNTAAPESLWINARALRSACEIPFAYRERQASDDVRVLLADDGFPKSEAAPTHESQFGAFARELRDLCRKHKVCLGASGYDDLRPVP